MIQLFDGTNTFSSHAALEHDLEHALVLSDPDLRSLHALREARRVCTVLEAGGFAAASPSALALVRPLPWDTAHFGLPCADLARFYASPDRPLGEARAVLEETVAECRRRGVALLSARVLAGDVEATTALLGLGATLVDTSVELAAALPLARGREAQSRAEEGGLILRGAVLPSDAEALRGVAATFTENRFHRDPRIPRERAREVYQRWALSAAAGEHGELLLVEAGGKAAGFATWSPPDDEIGVALIGLLAVSPEMRGRRILSTLVHGCIHSLTVAAAGSRAVATSTQVSNVRALRGFGRCGLLPVGARHIFHLWLAN